MFVAKLFMFMNKKQELETELKTTLSALLDIVNDTTGIVLKVDEPTAKELSDFIMPVKFNLEVSLISDDKLYPYKKQGKALYKWIWNLPSQKRSYSGRILK